MAKLLSILSLILAIVLFPPATLAVISNNAVPGDATYPIKRALEDGIFAVASLNPVTKAWFAAARSDRRFKEFTTLVTQGKKTSDVLNELVEQTQVAASQIAQVKDEAQKQKLVLKLSESIKKYDQGLQQVSSPIQVDQAPIVQTTPLPQATPFTPESASPVATVLPSPTPTPPPVVQPTPTPVQPDDEERQRQIEEARRRLEEIRRRLERQQRRQDEGEHRFSSEEARQPIRQENREESRQEMEQNEEKRKGKEKIEESEKDKFEKSKDKKGSKE